MRFLMVLGIALALAGCKDVEKDARRELTAAQQQIAAGAYIDGIKALRAIVEKYPETTSATEAMRVKEPLEANMYATVLGCVRFRSDTGRDLDSAHDLVERSRMVDGWKGPYVTDQQLQMFGAWIMKNGCRDE